MRTTVTAVLVAALLATGATAATITGTGRGEQLLGSPRPDRIVAGGGNDRIAVQYDGRRDVVLCGTGRDVVTADRIDETRACEVVSRLIARDTYTTPDGQHETQVEPHALAAGSTVVATFQTGRRHSGGAADIGFSTSRDGGRTWLGGHLPALTVNSRPAGTAAYASDPVVAYDERHGVWLISTLAVSSGLTELYISRSADGRRWSPPVVAAQFAGNSLAFDKNWAACDNWPQSPSLGRCYLAYTDHVTRIPRIAVQTSDDGGLTWSPAVIAVAASEAVGVLPLPRPDGSLVVVYLGPDETQAAVRSTDGGRTFEAPVTIADYQQRRVPGIRAFPLPTADVDAQGRLYVAWHDCRFRPSCAANDIVLSTSPDGASWSVPARVTRDGGSDFMPALAVEPATGELALSYHRCAGSPCRIDVLVARSGDRGASWSRPQLVTAQPIRTAWLPTTTSGRMLGDYTAVPWARGRPVAVYSLASPPRGGKLRQAIAAAPLP